jgi:hypothetical protein
VAAGLDQEGIDVRRPAGHDLLCRDIAGSYDEILPWTGEDGAGRGGVRPEAKFLTTNDQDSMVCPGGRDKLIGHEERGERRTEEDAFRTGQRRVGRVGSRERREVEGRKGACLNT